MNIGENIKKVRKLKGMSQKELSDLSGVPRVSISRYENNERTPTIDIVKKLSDALSINLEILANWTDILNVEPNVIDFLDEVFCGFNFLEELALFLNTTPNSKAMSSLFNEDYLDKSLFLKTAKLLELTDVQLCNWVLYNRMTRDFYNNEPYIRKCVHKDDPSILNYDLLNYMITSNKANLDMQPFDELFYNGISNANKSKIQDYLYKIYNKSIDKNSSIIELSKEKTEDYEECSIDIKYNPTIILKSILAHSKNIKENNNKLEYLTDEQMSLVLDKVVDLVEYELYKIKKNN